MATNIKYANVSMNAGLRNSAAKVGRFLWHLLQMVLAMEVGMMVYHILVAPLLAQTPYAALTDAYPVIGYWMMVVFMALGMLALMLLQKANGRYCLEMTLAMVAPVAALTVLALCSLIPFHILYAGGDPVMIVAMAGYMLYRPHEYAHGAHGQSCH